MNPSLGRYVCAWIERFLVHGEGDHLGKPFALDPWQRRFIYRLYEFDRETAERIVRRVLMVLPKGQGKTELAAAIALVELAGPSCLLDGRPSRRLSPNIPVGAASYEQADRLFGAAKTMVEEGPLSEFIESFDTELLLKGETGRMYRIAAVAGTNDGTLPTAAFFDEVHEFVGTQRERVHQVVGNSLTKRAAGLEFNITTPDDADPTSVLGRMFDYGKRVAAGEVTDPTFLFEWHTTSENVNLDDPAALRAAITEASPASWIDIERIARRWEIDRIPPEDFRRYHLAQFVRGANRWLPAGAWEACTDADRVVDDREAIVLGFDGSDTRDSTALIGCTLDGHVFVVGAWERPANAADDWRVPREDVNLAVDRAMERYAVRELACDPWGWRSEMEEWANLYGSLVVEFKANQTSLMAPACSRFYSAVVQGDLTHDGDARLSRHVHNAVKKESRTGWWITKEGPNSPRKIDLAVGAVIAYERATAGVAVGPWLTFV